MNDKKLHINDTEDDFLKRLQPSYNKTKEVVWEELSGKIDSNKKPKTIKMFWYKAAAAIIILLATATIVLRFYSVTVKADSGEHISCNLPDNSVVTLNAESEITYNPLWWSFKREVEFSGEAFFKVEKGKKFKVISKNGITEVLGTSFNIYSRNTDYKVFCKTGKVKISNPEKSIELILHPNESGKLYKAKAGKTKTNSNEALAWKNNKFKFSSTPLGIVFKEVERQYNIKISSNVEGISDYKYSGFFKKSKDAQATIKLICESFNFEFEKKSKKEYKIIQKRED